ncbi:MAG TPA: stage II sporulation protein M [Firmicutes bacterium]|nr:stage II sporulation protein M [Bacillota bacterium]
MRALAFLYRVHIPRILRAGRRYIAFATLLFVIGVLSGFWLYRFHPLPTFGAVQGIVEKFKHLGNRVEDLGMQERIIAIFWNNLRAVLLCVASGVAFGIFPIIAIFLNGFFIGVISSNAASRGLDIAAFLLVGVLPHGVFEIPAFILGGVLGMRLGLNILAYERGRQQGRMIVRVVYDAIIILLALVIPLLFVAALVEMTVTRFLVEWVLGPAR